MAPKKVNTSVNCGPANRVVTKTIVGPPGPRGAAGPAGMRGAPGANGDGISSVVQQNTACGIDLVFTSSDGTTTVDIGKRARIVQNNHGLGAVGSVKAVRVSLTGVWSLAQSNSFDNAADFLALIVDSNTIDILATGLQLIPAHGLGPLDTWLVVSDVTAGAIINPTALLVSGMIQTIGIPLSTNCIYVEVSESGPPIVACDVITQTAHGFTIPSAGVLPLRWDSGTAKWIAAIADASAHEALIYAIEIVDANSFRIAEPGFIQVSPAHGLAIGSNYYLSPTTAGGIVPASSINFTTQCAQKVLTVISTTCVWLNPSEIICPP